MTLFSEGPYVQAWSAPDVGVCFAAGGRGLGRASDKAPGQWWRVGVGCMSAADGARAPDSSEPGRTWSRLGDKGP